MGRSSLLFCAGALLASLLLAAVVYPFAAMPPERVAAATPVSGDEIAPLDLGDFGEVTVTELLDYYIENPPAPRAAGSAPPRTEHFGGC